MIHRQSRNELALALRQYVSGRINNDDLDSVAVDWRDRGAVYVQEMAWNLYDDLEQHHATGKHYLDKKARKEVAKWVTFLHSETEYIWPEYSFMQIVNWPMNIVTLGWWEKSKKRKWEQFLEAGEFEAWPFASSEELHKCIRRPRLLAGNAEQGAASDA